MFITKKKHKEIVANYEDTIKYLKYSLEKARDVKELLNLLVKDRKNYLTADNTIGITCSASGGYELSLPDTVPVYLEDVNGGKVIKQEATPVTILDENGKATYGYTKQAPDKGKKYQLKV